MTVLDRTRLIDQLFFKTKIHSKQIIYMHQQEHKSVLLKESVEQLVKNPRGVYLDATFGRGGHSQAILAKLKADGQLFAIDQDPSALEFAQALTAKDARFKFIATNFENMRAQLQKLGIEKLDGILFDLGVSSPQLDRAERGFSFNKDGPLDMRMNPNSGISASAFLKKVTEKDLREIFWQYGEERFARKIAAAIIKYRAKDPIKTTLELAEIIKQAHPRWEKNKHPATRCFQALRIYLNRELEVLQVALEDSIFMLKPDAILAVISFHSLEDRIVKRFIRKAEQGAPPPLPQEEPLLKRVGKPIVATSYEVAVNNRSRSAVLRIAQRSHH